MAAEHGRRALEIARANGSPSLLAFALHTTAWTLLRTDPVAALAATEEAIELSRDGDLASGTLSGRTPCAGCSGRSEGTSTARSAHSAGRSRCRATTGNDRSFPPALGWGIVVLQIADRPEPAATFVGALNSEALRNVGNHPRAERGHGPHRVEQLRVALGDDVDAAIARGAAMSYEEIVEYVLAELDEAAAALADGSRPRVFWSSRRRGPVGQSAGTGLGSPSIAKS